MNTQLIMIRLKSFFWSVLSLVGTTIIGVLLSSDFATVVTQNFGPGVVSTLILLSITEGVKHLRNMQVLKSAGLNLGSTQSTDVMII